MIENMMPLHLANFIAQRPLSARNCLVPLFEALRNSFDALQDARNKKGTIRIQVLREPVTPISAEPGLVSNQPITGFIVEDNGIGFVDANFDSFNLAGSPQKVALGGKGMGRLTWLKTFRRTEIDSSFTQHGKRFRRRFTFTMQNAVDNHTLIDASDGTHSTTVSLLEYLPIYRASCPKSFQTLARRIIRHFLSSFILDTCPQIVLVDEQSDESMDLKKHFNTDMQLKKKQGTFKIDGEDFIIQHLCLAAGQESSHEVHFCARNSSVESRAGSDLIPCLRAPLHDGSGKGRAFFYAGCVSGGFLEHTVREDRTSFDIPSEKNLMQGEKEITWEKLLDEVAHECDKFLDDYLKPQREDNNSRIIKYITEREPKYRPLIKHKLDCFDRISPLVSEDNLGLELFKLWHEYEIEIKAKQRLTKQRLKSASSIERHKAAFVEFMSEMNEHGMATLADYVVHRRAVLDFLRESIAIMASNKYVGEDQIHTIICPMKTTSDDVSPDQMNLWVIDERLSYHHYLSSDRPFNQVKPVKVDSQERADLLIFTHPVAFTDDTFGAVVIVEFKKPMRNDYSEKENPIAQVYGYIEKLRSGRALDKNQRPIVMKETTPIFAYIVADATDNLKRFIKDKDFQQLPDANGWFNYHKVYGAYVEVITFSKLLTDAEKRNAAFFRRLNLPLPSGPIL